MTKWSPFKAVFKELKIYLVCIFSFFVLLLALPYKIEDWGIVSEMLLPWLLLFYWLCILIQCILTLVNANFSKGYGIGFFLAFSKLFSVYFFISIILSVLFSSETPVIVGMSSVLYQFFIPLCFFSYISLMDRFLWYKYLPLFISSISDLILKYMIYDEPFSLILFNTFEMPLIYYDSKLYLIPLAFIIMQIITEFRYNR